jgi:hypothetical protein
MGAADRMPSEPPSNPELASATLIAVDAAPMSIPSNSGYASNQKIPDPDKKPLSALSHDYKGFVSGVFSGIAKLTGELSPGIGALPQAC